MATLDDLTEAELNAVIALDLIQEIENVYGMIAEFEATNDVFNARRLAIPTRLSDINRIVGAGWASAQAAADLILNPEE